MANQLKQEWLGQVVELIPGDTSASRSMPRPDLAAPTLLQPSDDAQEILFSPPGQRQGAEPLRIFFETGADDIALQVERATESLFVLGWREAWREFEGALRGTAREVFAGVTAPAPVQGETLYKNPEETPKRHKLIELYPTAVRAVAARVDDAAAKTAPAAAEWARTLLIAHREMVVAEAFRYLLVAPSEHTASFDQKLKTIRTLLEAAPNGVDISGPDAAALVGALQQVRQPRDAMKGLNADELLRQVSRRADLAVRLAKAHPALVAAVPFLSVTTPAEDQSGIDARVAIAAEIERIAAPHPIVHRLWTTDAVDIVFREGARNPGADNDTIARRLSSHRAYRAAVGEALNDTLQACDGMLNELSDASEIWNYPRAVHAALDQQGVPRGSLVQAAAAEQLDKAGRQNPALEMANEFVNWAQLAALAGGATAPVAAVLEVVSLVLNAIELAEKLWRAWHQRRASRTHLNPGLSLAAEPSYGMVLLAIVTTAFSVFGVRQGVR